jgi:hypothetical protein
MQAAPCGHRLGISGQFRETLATDCPHMRQAKGQEATPLCEKSAKRPFDACIWSGGRLKLGIGLESN